MSDIDLGQRAVSKHLNAVNCQLKIFLEGVLPELFDNWWDQAVLNNLSFQQKQRLTQRNIKSLNGLDLAGLLRVFDGNWFQVSRSLNLTSETRHFVKEMQTVRNRWAHMNSEGCPTDDVYRDLDTLQRFSIAIGADDELVENIKEDKESLLRDSIQVVPCGEAELPKGTLPETNNSAEFEPGQIVFVKSDPTTRGAVVAVLLAEPENRFKVFIDGSIQTFYASQLQS